MKKLVALLLTAGLTIGCLAGCGNSTSDSAASDDASASEATEYTVAMITDYGDITDESFNQTTYEACKAFCDEQGVDFNYYKPAGDSTADRVASVEEAIDDGYNVLVMPGYAFAGTIVDCAADYPDVKFVVLDCGKGDLLEAGVTAAGEEYDYTPDNWNLEDYVDMSNVYCAIYQEELAGYMAGYAAVKLGYTKLGFLGGMAVPAVIRYGFGFVQGCDDAAAELGTNVDIQYAYGNQFYGDADITAAMDSWYAGGTEVVFACGGSIYTSVAEAAKKVDAKVIGVDVDQAANIDGNYGEGMTVTSAMKGLYATTFDTLTDVVVNGNWDNYVGAIQTLGLVSGDDPEANYVQIPMESTQWSDTFTQDDYKALVAAMYAGDITVDNSTDAMPETTNATVNDLGNIK